ncbi:hypothetical protein [Paenirhodobacter populi]|uniref:hypothetical protein n=1 Tax=Paenirhodobacter populi TaxID=2306993 RepID=UPI000FE43454|nr:hypothetical protein [Sinirhodobacter populi]
MTAKDVCDQLGRRAIAERIGRSVTAVSNAAVEGAFPPSWYIVLRDMCAAHGVACPEYLFNFLCQQKEAS